MAFRRQDIAKTTRKTGDGEPRRLYPRYAKDRSLLPKIDRAIDYLDAMVGRRRGDLDAGAVLDLFGDPKLARCLLTCLAEQYRYRTPSLAEALGATAARQLAAADLQRPAEVRAFAYLAANRDRAGFVDPNLRERFLSELASPLEISGSEIGEALHLDAERNAVLIRTGERARAEDVRARYNTLLTVSILRHASEVRLTLPGVHRSEVEALGRREQVPWRWPGADQLLLTGRRSGPGSWSPFGVRVARLTTSLLLLAGATPEAEAIVHLNGQPLLFSLAGFPIGELRQSARTVAGADAVDFVADLSRALATQRRQGSGALNGWSFRRPTEPIVVEGAVAMPELICRRADAVVALMPLPQGERHDAARAAIERISPGQPVIALGDAGSVAPSLIEADAGELVDLLDGISGAQLSGRTALSVVRDELGRQGWIGVSRLQELFGGDGVVDARVRSLTDVAAAHYVPGFGLCRGDLFDRLAESVRHGPFDVGALRQAVAATVGEGSAADALTLHLLTEATPPAAWALKPPA